MPASKLAVAGALFLVFTSLLGGFDNQPLANGIFLPPAASAISSALQWLASNQSSTGSYGDYFEHWTAAAAYALWLNNSLSPKAALSYSWLAVQLNSSSSWFWGQYGEADVPGAMLRSVGASQSLGMIDVTGVISRLLELQEPNGGFRGYYLPNAGQYGQNVASAVDTAMALWGLAETGTNNPSSRQTAIDYLVSLQNSDGSFNLTKTTASDPIYSQGPEPVSITALAVLALKTASYTNDSLLAKALGFLSTATSRNFTAPDTREGHVYSASLTALALSAFGRTGDASEAVAFILSHQNLDGGFSDRIRSSGAPNALDTGWAAIALQLVQTEPVPTGPSQGNPRLNPLVIAAIVASVVVPVAVILGLAVYYRRKKERVSSPASPIGGSVRS